MITMENNKDIIIASKEEVNNGYIGDTTYNGELDSALSTTVDTINSLSYSMLQSLRSHILDKIRWYESNYEKRCKELEGDDQ